MAPPRKLTMESARLIRELLEQGVTIGKLARDFRVSEGTIQAIKRGTAYRTEEVERVVRDGRPDWEVGTDISRLVDKYDREGSNSLIRESSNSPPVEQSNSLTGEAEKRGEQTDFSVDANSSDEDIARMLAIGRMSLRKSGHSV